MKFLIFGGPGIGDTIIELSLAKALKKGYPDCEIGLIVSDTLGAKSVIESILSCQDYIDQCFGYSKKSLIKTAYTLFKLRRLRYDYSFYCSTAFKCSDSAGKISKIINTRSIIKHIEGKTHTVDIPVKISENIHFVEQYEKLCKQLLPESKLDLLVLNPQKIKEFYIPFKTKKSVVICLGTNITIFHKNGVQIKKNIKSWDIDRWVQTANSLSDKGIGVALIGGKKEMEELNMINAHFSENVFCYAGKTSVQESLAIIRQSDLAVGADTGMMHCAAALGIKTITLFGGTDADIWRPYSDKGIVLIGSADCSPCYGKDHAIDCVERKCMNSITVQNVLDLIQEIQE